jgi:hypothetical protein
MCISLVIWSSYIQTRKTGALDEIRTLQERNYRLLYGSLEWGICSLRGTYFIDNTGHLKMYGLITHVMGLLIATMGTLLRLAKS